MFASETHKKKFSPETPWRPFGSSLLGLSLRCFILRVDLNVFVPGDFSFRWTEWGAAFWRLEIVELHHLLRGAVGIEDVWSRFEEAERSATRAFVWTKGLPVGGFPTNGKRRYPISK